MNERIRPDVDRVCQALRRPGTRLHAVLDGARDAELVRVLERGGAPFSSVADGALGVDLGSAAPFLVDLTVADELLGELVERGFGANAGIFVESRHEFARVRQHLARFLVARLPDGGETLFRFYDPRVLRTFVPTCSEAERANLFDRVDVLRCEDVLGTALLSFTRRSAAPIVLSLCETSARGRAMPRSGS
jgi:hypothetical protein